MAPAGHYWSVKQDHGAPETWLRIDTGHPAAEGKHATVGRWHVVALLIHMLPLSEQALALAYLF